MACIRIVRPGLLTTVQDEGRVGYGHLGVPKCGALDAYALRWAQRLAGEGRESPALEVTLLGPTIEIVGETSAGLAGADLGASLNGVPWPPGEGRHLRAGDVIAFSGPREGLRAYLAFRGGVEAGLVLGSRSTDLQSGIGGFHGRPLRAGDVLSVGEGCEPLRRAPVPTMRGGDVVRVMAGPRDGLFPGDALTLLTRAPYTVKTESDRVGMRLQGEPIPKAPGSILSEGMPLGAIQVPPSGQPIVLLHARGTVGGYPVLATVISADLPVLAQRKPGEGVRFTLVDLWTAREALRAQSALLEMPLVDRT